MTLRPESLEKIFNAFEQAAQSRSRQFGGLGLGLTISRALVEMHQGAISARSLGPGKGATFEIRLPLSAPARQSETTLPIADQKRRPIRILLVEDHGISAKMIAQVLEGEGHQVDIAGAVADALEVAGERHFDLLVSDLGLPDGTGHDLMKELRARGHNIPGIALTGYGQEIDIQQSYEVGFSAHLVKPASRERLNEAIASAMAGKDFEI